MARETVEKDKVVTFTYVILDAAGRVIEQHDMPKSYIHGREGGLLSRIEDALEGRGAGERMEVKLPPEEGFGVSDPALIISEDLENVPPPYRAIGAQATFQNERGETKEFRVTGIEDGKLTLDGNHPLAGQTAIFVAEILEIRDATPEELEHGLPEQHILH
jgi:FKBP-type peptidyl-prolyl cis-trans isomerase SlyD